MDASGTTVGTWELGRELGRGAMGRVYAAWGPRGDSVAVKLVDRPVDLVDEVWAMAQLDHPSIVGLLDAGRVTEEESLRHDGVLPGAPWLAMEKGEGPLDGLRQPRDWAGLKELLHALLAALAHAHARQVVHRDIKPRNILWFGAGVWKLGDFGIAHALGRHDPDHRMNRSAGTPTYMAPEQLEGRWRDLGPWTDLYSLGCLAWHQATGEPPWPGTDVDAVFAGHLGGALPRFEPLYPVPAGLDEWLARMLEKRPADRWVRAADARHALDRLEGIDPGPPLGPDWRPEPASRSRLRLARPRVVGREDERDRLWALLCDAKDRSTTHAVVLEGPPGSGRSRLARWLQQRAHEVGAGWIFEAEHDLDGGPTTGLAYMLASFLRSVGLPRQELEPRLARILADEGFPDPALAAAAASFIGGTGLARAERFRLLIAALAVATRSTPGNARSPGRVATLLLDDVHWGEESLAFVRFLLRPENRFMPVLALCTVDPSSGSERVARHLAALREAGALFLRLEELPRSDDDELLDAFPVGAPDDADATYDGPRPGAVSASDTWDAPHFAWEQRIDGALRGSLPDRDALELAAALGLRLDRAELDAVLKAAGATPSPRWPAALVDAGVLLPLGLSPGGLAFASREAAEAVGARAADAGRWGDRHAIVARVLQARGAAPERIARHLLQAGNLEETVPALALAARAALDRGDPHRARELALLRGSALDRLGADVTDARRHEVAALLAEALAWTGTSRDG